ncbi:MAG: hypothetical protein ABW023_08610 [Sphingomonas sp.]
MPRSFEISEKLSVAPIIVALSGAPFRDDTVRGNQPTISLFDATARIGSIASRDVSCRAR